MTKKEIGVAVVTAALVTEIMMKREEGHPHTHFDLEHPYSTPTSASVYMVFHIIGLSIPIRLSIRQNSMAVKRASVFRLLGS